MCNCSSVERGEFPYQFRRKGKRGKKEERGDVKGMRYQN
jgi:hypothetical protein